MNLHKVFISAIFGAGILVCGDIKMAQAYPAPYTCTRNFYVATTGFDAAGCGTSQANACASIQGANNNIALQAGDCVNVAAGTYNTNYQINLTKGGSSNQANGYVTYVGAPNRSSKINYSSGAYYGLQFQTNYVIIDGFEFAGNNAIADSMLTAFGPHHLMMLNNSIHDNVGGGIQTLNPGGSTNGGDYFLIAGNTIYNTALCSPYGQSGISIFHPLAITNLTALPWDSQYYHIQIIDNIVYSNGRTIGSSCPANNDGNGIIADDWQQQQISGGISYAAHALIFGNITYNNRGSGIRVFNDANIDVYNNTTYNNGQNTFCDPVYGCPSHAELLMSGANMKIANNVLFAAPGAQTILWISAFGKPDNGDSVFNNLTWNGTTGSSGVVVSGTTNDSGYLAGITAASSNNKLGVNPLLANVASLDFHPLSGSPAIIAGAALPTGVLPGPLGTADAASFTAPPSIGAFNSSAPNSVSGPVSVSAGGPAAAPFIADAGFNGGTPAGPGNWTVDTSLVTNTTPAPQSVYLNQRYGSSFFYVVSALTPGKTYQAVLHFTEDWNTAAGQRQQNVSINGTQVLNAFDIFAAAGAQHKAVAKSFNATADANGKITISFAAVPGRADANAKVDGIQVLNVTAPPVAANQAATTPYNTPVNVNLANGASGNPTSAAIIGTPSGGAVTLNGLTATFTPNAGFSGSGSFQFTLSNAGGTSSTATATITVGAPPAAGQVEDFQYLAGNWYLPDLVLPATAGPSATGPNLIRCAPGGLRNKATIGNVGGRVFTADPSGHLQFAIYTNGANQRPANLVATSASMSAATAGVISSALSANVQGGPNGANLADTFWFCANADSAAARFASVNSVPSVEAAIIGSGSAGNVLQGAGTGVAISHLSTPGTYGTWPPSLASASWTEQTSIAMPMMAIRFSSVP